MADLAALREAVYMLGGNPLKVNPLCPADLVVDHSVQVCGGWWVGVYGRICGCVCRSVWVWVASGRGDLPFG